MTPEKRKKAEEYNQRKIDAGELTIAEITEMVLCWQEVHGLAVDGWCGPNTLSSLESIMAPQAAPTNEKGLITWKPWDGPLQRQPKNRKELYEIFGNPGSGSLDQNWKRNHIIELHQKHGNRLPGVPSRWYVHIHREVEPYLREALRRAQIAAPDYEIERIGSFNFRHIRHDPRRPLSTHSWGIAVDIDPHRNRSKTFERGQAPKAFSGEYMKIWPDGVPRAFVEAMQSCGFAWGSDWDEDGQTDDHTFLDPMHFEFVARDGNALLV